MATADAWRGKDTLSKIFREEQGRFAGGRGVGSRDHADGVSHRVGRRERSPLHVPRAALDVVGVQLDEGPARLVISGILLGHVEHLVPRQTHRSRRGHGRRIGRHLKLRADQHDEADVHRKSDHRQHRDHQQRGQNQYVPPARNAAGNAACSRFSMSNSASANWPLAPLGSPRRVESPETKEPTNRRQPSDPRTVRRQHCQDSQSWARLGLPLAGVSLQRGQSSDRWEGTCGSHPNVGRERRPVRIPVSGSVGTA